MSVTDGTNGQPVDGLPIRLERFDLDSWQPVWNGITRADGRSDCAVDPRDVPGAFRLTLETARYFTTLGQRPFYSHITVDFSGEEIVDRQELPVVVTPRGYTVCAVG
ncbi:hydroxyisourate hydrolase [Streptomyces sp. HUAS MG91]|uniref:Hydroxyisourate hydrolase n=1 Tax=Streptomyces tabacisoli TaxID=3156398 RepID=A0AAU8IRJ3_9ACTN